MTEVLFRCSPNFVLWYQGDGTVINKYSLRDDNLAAIVQCHHYGEVPNPYDNSNKPIPNDDYFNFRRWEPAT